jgi:hypothetical protein
MSNEVRPVVAIACSSAGVSFKPAHRRTATRATCDCCGARKLRASWSASGSAQRSCSSSTTCKPTQPTGTGRTAVRCSREVSAAEIRPSARGGAIEPLRYDTPEGRNRMLPLLAAPLSPVQCGQKRSARGLPQARLHRRQSPPSARPHRSRSRYTHLRHRLPHRKHGVAGLARLLPIRSATARMPHAIHFALLSARRSRLLATRRE